MRWNVKKNNQEINLDVDQLISILIPKAFESAEKEDFEIIAKAFVERLSTTKKLVDISPTVLADMFFRLGFYYSNFQQINEVNFEPSTPTGQSSNEQPDFDYESIFV